MDNLSWALNYARRGWPVVVIWGIDERGKSLSPSGRHNDPNMRGKVPVPKSGKTRATTDPGTLVELFQEFPLSNVGICTGKDSGIFVLDVDPRNGGDESLKKLEEEYNDKLHSNFQVDTGGGGQHYYFAHPDNILLPTGVGGLGAGLDIKGDAREGGIGGYVVAPESRHASGNFYTWKNYVVEGALPVDKAPKWILELIWAGVAEDHIQGADDFVDGEQEIPEGFRHSFLLSRAGKMRQAGLGQEALLEALKIENLKRCRPPISGTELSQIAGDVGNYKIKNFRLDDIGNGKRLCSQAGSVLRHCYTQNQWYVWDKRRWGRDEIGRVFQFAKQTIESIHSEALLKTDKLRESLSKHASRSGLANRVKSMVDMARTEVEVAVRVDQLDSDRTVLNCLNGTLSLESGRLSKHQPRDLLTKLAPVEYEPSAKSEEWEQFLEQTCDGDKQLIQFLQRTAGYALSGLTEEENIFFIYGPGGTGKTTYVEAIKGILGDDYCKTASFSTFLKAGNIAPNAPRSDIARLVGARLVAAIEMAKGRQLAEDLVKAATGGDKLVTRGLYEKEFEFIPQYKLWLASNDKPRVREDDTGLWRRFLLLPFYHVVKKPNKQLKDIFRKDARIQSAILNWCAKGFQDWRRDGWSIPDIVREETSVYRAEMDPLVAWLDDCCEVGQENASTPFRNLWIAYEGWIKTQPQAVRNGRIESMKAFGIALQKRGFERDIKRLGGRQQKVYAGIELVF